MASTEKGAPRAAKLGSDAASLFFMLGLSARWLVPTLGVLRRRPGRPPDPLGRDRIAMYGAGVAVTLLGSGNGARAGPVRSGIGSRSPMEFENNSPRGERELRSNQR